MEAQYILDARCYHVENFSLIIILPSSLVYHLLFWLYGDEVSSVKGGSGETTRYMKFDANLSDGNWVFAVAQP